MNARLTHRPFSLVVIVLLSTACEKVDLSEFNNGDTPGNHSVVSSNLPASVGEGTQDAPYTVDQIIDGDLPAESLWLIGYVVGSTYRTLSNASFTIPTTYTSNILLSFDSACTSVERCIPVELSTTALQKAVGLASNSERHRQCAMVQGIPNRYFSTNGIRNVSAAYWLPGFDISTIDPRPTPWEETEEEY